MSPKIPEDPPRQLVIERDGQTYTIGEGGDLTWADVEALQTQIDRHNTHSENKIEKLTPTMIGAIVATMRVFCGSMIEDFSLPITPRRRGHGRDN